MEISNKNGVVYYGSMILPDEIQDDYADKALDSFIESHRVKGSSEDVCAKFDAFDEACAKFVAFDEVLNQFIQLQAAKVGDCFCIQKFDEELQYIGEELTTCRYISEAKDYMKANYKVLSGLQVNVYRSVLGDCTNGGISSNRDSLYILTGGGPFRPSDIRECITIEEKNVMGKTYLYAKPVYCPKCWYMAGGNFIYASDSRYVDVTGLSYPVSLHDRCEGRSDNV